METAFHTPNFSNGAFMTSRAPARTETFRVPGIAKPQKAFAIAFAVLAAALAGCASGLGASAYDQTSAGLVTHVDEGTVVGVRSVAIQGGNQSAYTIRLPSGELVSVAQAGDYAIPAGTPVLVEYGANARVMPTTDPL